MKFLIKTSKGYICYRDYGEYAYTQFRDDAKIYSDRAGDIVINGSVAPIAIRG